MYSLELSAEQIEFRDTVRDFVAREIKPVATHPDRLQRLQPPFPADLLARTAQLGLRAMLLDEDAGGAGADTLSACIVIEELATGDVDVACALAQTLALAPMVHARTSVTVRSRWLARFMTDESAHIGYAPMTDSSPGWRYHRARAGTGAKRTVAVRRADAWVLDGDLGFVANAPIAADIAVEVESPDGPGMLLVPRDTPGLELAAVQAADGSTVKWYHGAGANVTCRDCTLPLDHFSRSSSDAMPLRERCAVLQAAANLGVGRAAFEAAVDYAKLRVQGGRPIIQHQALGIKLADVAIRLDAARSMIWKSAWALDHPHAVANRSIAPLPWAVAARAYTAEVVHAATENSAECFGAMGVMLDMPLQKNVHDAVVFLNSGVSDVVDKFEVAEAVAGFDAGAGAEVRRA